MDLTILIFCVLIYSVAGTGTALAVRETIKDDYENFDHTGRIFPEKCPPWFALTITFVIWPAIVCFALITMALE